MVAVALIAAAPVRAAGVRLEIGPFSPRRAASAGAVGLLVPGRGPTVSRREALEALGPLPRCRRHCPFTILLSLPPPGRHHNGRRYPVAIVGPGYRGILSSSRTRIPGLVSIFDVAPTVSALESGRTPPVRSRRNRAPLHALARLDSRLSRTQDVRTEAMLILISALVVYGLIGLGLASPFFARAALLAPSVALGCSLLLSAVGASRQNVVVVVLAVVTGVGSLVASALLRTPLALGVALLALIVAYLVVMTAWPDTNALAALGPNPASGSRFYGLRNDVSTVLLLPALLAGALLGRRLLAPVAVLVLLTVGASAAGADGGGALVVVVGFLVLALRTLGLDLTWRRLVAVGVAAVGLGLGLVGLDRALGGSSHVTRAVGGGPGTLFGDVGHRLHTSWNDVTSSWYHLFLFGISVAALLWLTTRRPRTPVLDALLVAIAASLLVNDTPTDVAGFGALSALALWSWQRSERIRSVDSRPCGGSP